MFIKVKDMANPVVDHLGQLHAPVKGFYTFEESAHSPMFEEPGRMRQILQEDVLTGRNRLADSV